MLIRDSSKWKTFFRKFVMELESDDGVFATSSFANKVREALNKSAIYQLIVAQHKYEDYINHDANSLDAYEYNRRVSEYTDLLMSPKLPAILPPDKVDENYLFENPEYELQKVIDNHNKQTVKLNPHITRKIQDFFLLKHSTLCAYTNKCSQTVFIGLNILMSVCSIAMIIISLCGCLNTCSFSILLVIYFIILIFFNINAVHNKRNNNKNSAFLRVFIALITSWSLVTLSGDFVFSYLEATSCNVICFILVSIVLIIAALWYDSISHSRYYKIGKNCYWKKCNWKILPVLSFSIFLSLSIGIVLQLAIYQPLLKTGNTLYSVTFSSEFKDIEHHITNTQLLIDNLEAYKREIFHFPKDSSKIHTSRKNHINTIKQKLHHQDWFNHITEKELKTNREIAHHIDTLLPLLHSHMHSHQNFITQFYDANSLLKLCCDTTSYVQHRVIYNEFFKKDKFIENIIPVKVEFCCIHISFYLFPKLLVFHAFLAVLIAFIVQIIFTGKSVTEGLQRKE